MPSSSDSSRGSHHPSRECFKTSNLEGHIESIHEEEATLIKHPHDSSKGMLLGFIIFEHSIEANPEKILAITRMGPI